MTKLSIFLFENIMKLLLMCWTVHAVFNIASHGFLIDVLIKKDGNSTWWKYVNVSPNRFCMGNELGFITLWFQSLFVEIKWLQLLWCTHSLRTMLISWTWMFDLSIINWIWIIKTETSSVLYSKIKARYMHMHINVYQQCLSDCFCSACVKHSHIEWADKNYINYIRSTCIKTYCTHNIYKLIQTVTAVER